MTSRVGARKSASAVPWRRNSGLRRTCSGGNPSSDTIRRVPPTGVVLRMTMRGPRVHLVLDRVNGRDHLREVARAVVGDRRPHAQLNDLVSSRARPSPHHDAAVRYRRAEDVGDAGLKDGHVAALQQRAPILAGLDELDAVAEPDESDAP